jgi:ABC-type microcin C transport system permease subunit YejB
VTLYLKRQKFRHIFSATPDCKLITLSTAFLGLMLIMFEMASGSYWAAAPTLGIANIKYCKLLMYLKLNRYF